jgi:hypothetical protein
MSYHSITPIQLPSVDVTTFGVGSKTKVLEAVRNRRLFGIANTGTTVLEVWLQPDGAGSPIKLRAASTLSAADGGSLEFAGYNGEVWVNGTGYAYHYAQ